MQSAVLLPLVCNSVAFDIIMFIFPLTLSSDVASVLFVRQHP